MSEFEPEHVERRGRRTKEEEAWSYLAELGVTPDQVALLQAAKTGKVPTTFAEMLDLAAADLWTSYSSLPATAKVQAFKAIQALARDEGDGAPPAEGEPLVADVVDGIVQLEPGRKREILEVALVRLDEERTRIREVLNANG